MKKNRVMLWIFVVDLLWVAMACLGADLLRYGFRWGATQRIFIHDLLPLLLLVWLLWGFLSDRMQLDGFRGGWRFPAITSSLLLGVLLLMTALLATTYLRRQYVSRLALGYFGVLLFLGFTATRYGAYLLLRARHRAGKVGRVVILGTGQIAQELASKINRHPEMLCKVVGFLYPGHSACDLVAPGGENGSSTLSTLGAVDLLRSEHIDELILAASMPTSAELLNLTARCRELGINVSLVPQPYELYLSKPDLLDLGGLPLLRLQQASTSVLFAQWKLITDFGLSLVLGILAIPVLAPSALILRFSKGRAFRWEIRSGRYGNPFRMLRLNVDRTATDIPRFERFLRHLSITELPQLLNVLRGDMSLVGPRPESPVRVRHYSEWQQQRLSVKPGMTGLAQVNGLREQHSSEDKTRFDLQYLLHPSPLGDLSLLLQTFGTLAVRVLSQSKRTPLEPTPSGNQGTDDFWFPSVEEAIQHAHRSQPSAD
jgi:lipopolysaccharide/colanic/teichoic acid biosynthesis glycosyltransferase